MIAPPGEMQPPPGHLQRVDLLRALAICMVFCFHGFEATFPGSDLPWGGNLHHFAAAVHPAYLTFYLFSFGKLGVPLFFVISGFCIHLSYLKWERRRAGWAGSSWQFIREFYFRRFWRIYPVYLVALAFFTWFGISDLANAKTLKLVVVHAALLHNFSPGHFFAINPAFWSIAVEWQLYLIYPLVVIVRRTVGATPAFVFLILFGILYRAWVPGFVENSNWHFALSQMPFAYWPQWLIGAWVAERWVTGQSPLRGVRIWTVAVLSIFAAMNQYQPTSAWSFEVAPLFFALLIEVCIRNQRPLNHVEKALLPIGLCSYSIYLFHCVIFQWFDWIHRHLYSALPFVDLTITLVALFLLILVPSWLSYRYLELGSVQLGHWLWQRLRKASPRPVFGPLAYSASRE